jgi:pimeloyl-ACP methyl ester carboxylesterase
MKTSTSLLLATFAAALVAGSAAHAAGLTLEPIVFQANDGRTTAAEAGVLEVPERHDVEGSPEIRLALVLFRSTSTDPGPPIFYLAGGPGNSGTVAPIYRFESFQRMRQFGDVIALDQRGTGQSEPNLDCRQKTRWPFDRVLTRSAALDQYIRQARKCARTWRRRGIDLDAYNSAQAAEDLDVLRQALGADQMVLWGISYGTHLALATIQAHGDRVARAILHGVEGPDHTLKLPRNVDRVLSTVARMARKDPAIGSEVPDLEGSLQALYDELEATPRTRTIVDPETGREETVTFGGWEVFRLFSAAMGDSEFLAELPALVRGMELEVDAVWDLVAGIVLDTRRRQPLGSAMGAATDCAAGASEKRLKKIARQAESSLLGATVDFPFPDICAGLEVAVLGDAARAKVVSAVPTLFVSGNIDGRTPPSNANEIARGFANRQKLLLVGASHSDLLDNDPRVLDLLDEFMSGQELSTKRLDKGFAFGSLE